jgi:hypothetical protein
MKKFIKKLTILVLAVMIPLSSSAYPPHWLSPTQWTSRTDENGDDWNAYAYNLEWNFKDYTLTVKKRPGHLVNNKDYWYKDEDGTYGKSYENEMLDYFGRCTIAGWDEDGLLIEEVLGWVNFSISMIAFLTSFYVTFLNWPAKAPAITNVVRYQPASRGRIMAGQVITYKGKTWQTNYGFSISEPSHVYLVMS